MHDYHGHSWGCHHHQDNSITGVRAVISLRNTNPNDHSKPYVSHRTEEVNLSLLDEYTPEAGWIITSIKIGSFV